MRAVAAWAWPAVTFTLAPGTAFAEGSGPGRAPSPVLLLLQALLALAVVIAIIYLVYFGLRRLTARQPGASDRGPLEVLQAKHLGGDRWLYVVRIAGRTLVVGGGTGQVQPIADLGEIDVQGASPDEGEMH